MAPFQYSPTVSAILTVVIGFFFGFVLERAGFGNARNLAAQFYLYDMRVLKVMFTAIVTAMVLVFAASAVGLLDFNLVWVPPTYFWPGVVGGFILGLGFIVGGYCPGTSLVSASTLKVDGALFVVGVMSGLFVFAQAVPAAWEFYNQAGYAGRLTLADWLGVDVGWVVLGVVVMAVGAFAMAEMAERFFDPSKRDQPMAPGARLLRRLAVAAALLLAVISLAFGQPGIERRIAWQQEQLDGRLASREIHIDPAEVLGLMHNNQIPRLLIDVRGEADYNLFHLVDAQRVLPEQIDAEWTHRHVTPETVVVVMSNDEAAANEAWKRLAVQRGVNAYVMAGGLNRWLDVYLDGRPNVPGPQVAATGDDTLRHRFPTALGDRVAVARPGDEAIASRTLDHPKVKVLQPVRAPGGGCG